MNDIYNAIYTLDREGDLVPNVIYVQENLTAKIYFNNNWEQDVVAQFAGTEAKTCPAGEITLLYTMKGGNVGLTDYINVNSDALPCNHRASRLVWTQS